MTNEQLYLAIGLPIFFNLITTTVLYTLVNQRFNDMRDLWRAELHRVEEVFDARLRALEERHHG
jgi:hypothetical protein